MKEKGSIKTKKDNNSKQIVKYVLVLLVGLLLGTSCTFFLSSNKTINIIKTNRTNSLFDSVYDTYEAIKNNYYKDVDDKVLINGAVKGMMDSLGDEHSIFFNEEEKTSFEDELAGSYYGIGAEIKQINEEDVIINKIFDGSPAELAGLKTGDIFEKIDGESVKGLSVYDIASNLKSKKKSTAEIVVKRDGEEITIKVEKGNVDLLSVSSEMLDDKIGYISVSIFGEKTSDQFIKALDKLEKDDMKSLIIDLRGNAGGYLTTVTKMLSEFVDKDTVIYQMKTKKGTMKYYSTSDKTKKYKVVVLVDESSASASEIMASALKEQYGATLVGKKTFGKGTVQETLGLNNNTLIKYTVEEWLTSKGESINGKGIMPDVEVDLSEEFLNSGTMENDNQLQKAIEEAK